MTRVLFIGDIHFKHNNRPETDVLFEELNRLSEPYDFAVLAGDILDTHERVDCQIMNRAYDLIRMLKKKSRVYICVGNHDMINNQQFLTSNHWMNGLKEWSNVTVVDTPVMLNDFAFVPYVYPGRFLEALNSLPNWKTATCIFAHQEIKGCKIGAFASENGDDWDLSFPTVISGHIHERHRPQANVFYPGSVLTHAFGGRAEEDQGLSVFTFDGEGGYGYSERRVSLGLRPKKTVYLKAGQGIKNKDLVPETRVVVSGTVDQIVEHKKSKLNSIMRDKGVKVVYKLDEKHPEESTKFKGGNFLTILGKLVETANDAEFAKDYRLVIS